ncbi:MAG TPA: alpha/beta hydrolase, partial [Reyranella sp.]|nr:alpha/beta hydrolase [Reyranella sp.]
MIRARLLRLAIAAAVGLCSLAAVAAAADEPAYGPELEGFDYPFPVERYRFSSQGQDLQMAYLDVKPSSSPNGRTIVLLHGKNFCAATWEGSIKALTEAGWRVIA